MPLITGIIRCLKKLKYWTKETAIEEIDEDGNGQIEIDEYLDWWGDSELIHLYEMQVNALEAGKPYRMMGDGSYAIATRFAYSRADA